MRSSRLLHDNKLYSEALYHLQQANEKLAKGLLIAMGMMTPKQSKEDWTTKALLGFLPRGPKDYGHRTVPSLLSDVSKAIPALDQWLQHLEAGEFGQNISDFRKSIKKSKKGVRTLQKRGIPINRTVEGLGNEIRATEELLGNVDKTVAAASAGLAKFDFGKATEAAIKSTRNLGLKFRVSELPSFLPLKDSFIPSFRLAVVGLLAIAFTAVLDPLESITRYPDSEHRFDLNNPYVQQFEGLHRVVSRLLDAGKVAVSSLS